MCEILINKGINGEQRGGVTMKQVVDLTKQCDRILIHSGMLGNVVINDYVIILTNDCVTQLTTSMCHECWYINPEMLSAPYLL